MIDLTNTTEEQINYVSDGSDASFVQDVVEASKDCPIIVDFWAPWCGPCKTLGPEIEKAVNAAKGLVKLVKIDIDKNQVYASQLRVQSVPTVYAFHNGQPVDGFQGALPASEIQAFVEKVAALNSSEEEGLEAAISAAEEMIDAGDIQDAIEVFEAIVSEDTAHAAAYAGLAKAHLALNDLGQAQSVLENAPESLRSAQAIESVFAQIALAREAENAGPTSEFLQLLEQDENNHQARLDLAVALHAGGDVEAAIEQLLELFKRDREWNEGAARAQLFKIFDALPADDALVLNGRRKLSSLVFT